MNLFVRASVRNMVRLGFEFRVRVTVRVSSGELHVILISDYLAVQ